MSQDEDEEEEEEEGIRADAVAMETRHHGRTENEQNVQKMN